VDSFRNLSELGLWIFVQSQMEAGLAGMTLSTPTLCLVPFPFGSYQHHPKLAIADPRKLTDVCHSLAHSVSWSDKSPPIAKHQPSRQRPLNEPLIRQFNSQEHVCSSQMATLTTSEPGDVYGSVTAPYSRAFLESPKATSSLLTRPDRCPDQQSHVW
jgi:hypothetical protein